MSDENEKPIQAQDEVEGHSVGKPITSKPVKPIISAQDDDESPDVEGHSMGKPVTKPVNKPV
jgi:hypothetical protein